MASTGLYERALGYDPLVGDHRDEAAKVPRISYGPFAADLRFLTRGHMTMPTFKARWAASPDLASDIDAIATAWTASGASDSLGRHQYTHLVEDVVQHLQYSVRMLNEGRVSAVPTRAEARGWLGI